MKSLIKYALIVPQDRTELLISISQRRNMPVYALFAGEKQSVFFNNIFTTMKYMNISSISFQKYLSEEYNVQLGTIVIMDIPNTFQLFASIVQKSHKNELLLMLINKNKKYINMVRKKNQVDLFKVEYNSNKIRGNNQKIRLLVEDSYSFNREAFYAYGEYLNYYQSNLLKAIFNTQDLDVGSVALSFGFRIPPRVNKGNFLTKKAQKGKKFRNEKKKNSQSQILDEEMNEKNRKIKKKKSILKLINKK